MQADWREAAVRGDAQRLCDLIEGGTAVDQRDRHGATALMIAAQRGHTAAVRVLVDAGADLDHRAKYGLSALMLAIVAGAEDAALLLVAAGADLGLRGSGAPGFADKTALDLALDCERTLVAAELRRRAP